jgi:predicted aspartyl protease
LSRITTPFEVHGDLIFVRALVKGPAGEGAGRFVLDTGAATTTIVPELAEVIGYTARDGRRTRVQSAIGHEEGYLLRVAEFAALGLAVPSFVVNVFDLGYEDLDGLLGMNFLNQLNYEVRSADRRILVERLTS